MILFLAIAGFILSVIPAGMFFTNLPQFQLDNWNSDKSELSPCVSVLIPARNEEASIRACVVAALASENVMSEVVVLDDQCTDSTVAKVNEIAANDHRVRCVAGQELPDGWNGKQYACWQLASLAKYETLVFLDADVRLQPNALAMLIYRKQNENTALLSAFPHQETGSWLEKLIIPMMHYILLCYLPFRRMRAGTDPAFAAGCGQLFVTNRDDYEAAGTHQAIQESRHDGIKLPRTYRSAGLSTDVVDGTALATCRMYTTPSEVIRGILKNAVEGIANPRLIVIFSILLLGSSVFPMVVLAWSIHANDWISTTFAFTSLFLGHLPRAIAAVRFRQSWSGVILHSVATTIFIILQWIALMMSLAGKQIAWRGRTQS